MSVYWDTSCLLKLYCREPDSEEYLKRMERNTEPLFTSSITLTELYFALLQKESRSETGSEKAKDIYKDFEADLSQGLIIQIPMGTKLFKQSREIADKCYNMQPPIPLRSLDGIHLAAALQAQCHTLVTTDQRMRAAAALLGLVLEEK